MTELISNSIVVFFGRYINPIIVGLFIINILIFLIIIYLTRSIRQFTDETKVPETARLTPDDPGESYLDKLRRNYEEWTRRYRSINPWLHYYSILTTIFPLLGILGTVCGLLQATADFADVQKSFLLALSSTFWGLVAAILSKAGEGVFAADIDRFQVIYEIFTKDMINLERFDGTPGGDKAKEKKEQPRRRPNSRFTY